MTNKHLFRGGFIILAGSLCAWCPCKAAPNKVVRIIQTNSAGDNVDIIDPVDQQSGGRNQGD